jgi:hypothetical protein
MVSLIKFSIMDFKRIFADKSDAFKSQQRWTAENGYRLARVIRFMPLGFMAIETFFKYYQSFSGTISGRLLSTGSYQNFPNNIGHVFATSNKEMGIYVHFNTWSDSFEPLYFLHMLCTNMKYIILFFVCSEIAKLFKSISEKRI